MGSGPIRGLHAVPRPATAGSACVHRRDVEAVRVDDMKLAELARPPWSLKERSTATSTTLTASQLHLFVSGPEDSTSIEVVVPHAQH
jgi:hypothetical protein